MSATGQKDFVADTGVHQDVSAVHLPVVNRMEFMSQAHGKQAQHKLVQDVIYVLYQLYRLSVSRDAFLAGNSAIQPSWRSVVVWHCLVARRPAYGPILAKRTNSFFDTY